MSKISDYILTLLLFLTAATATASNLATEYYRLVPADAYCAPPDTTKPADKDFKMVQYSKVTVSKKDVPLFSGYGIYTDLCGMGMATFSKWGQYEAGAHFGIKGKYFPAVEVGVGRSNHTDSRSNLHYKTNAPFFRIGLDYNLNKDLTSHNRYYVGLRYGFSAFTYDLDGPAIPDEYWHENYDFNMHNMIGNAHWGEILFGIQTQLWKFINLGWTFRYRARLYEKQAAPGHAYYVPGYGKNGESSGTFGGTFNIIFEL